MGQILSLPKKLLRTTYTYYRGLWYYTFGVGRYDSYNVIPSFLLSSSSLLTRTSKENAGTVTTTAVSSSDQPESDQRKVDLRVQHARIYLYSLACNFYLYNKPHYRKSCYRDDLRDNLRNVAVPGTGIPLSYFLASHPWIAAGYISLAVPALSLIAAVHKWWTFQKDGKRLSLLARFFGAEALSVLSDEYYTRLLAPDDWFHYWRLNCTVVAMHSLLNDMPADYEMENKWTFLQAGDATNGEVPVSPFLKSSPSYVIKHKNEEGGLGIHFYDNAVHGGDWIIQERIENSPFVASMLPPSAPLSTFRVITASRAYLLPLKPGSSASIDSSLNSSVNSSITAIPTANNSTIYSSTSGPDESTTEGATIPTTTIFPLSCVFRAGRIHALTDHDSILFDVDVNTGTIRGGTTNMHWYQLGLFKALFRCPWRSYDEHRIQDHPDGARRDSSEDGKVIRVAGNVIPNFQNDVIRVACNAHEKLCPSVPLAGWDVVLTTGKSHNDDKTTKSSVCLLEVNLSCNFFRGTFDEMKYFNFLDDMFSKLQQQRIEADRMKKKF